MPETQKGKRKLGQKKKKKKKEPEPDPDAASTAGGDKSEPIDELPSFFLGVPTGGTPEPKGSGKRLRQATGPGHSPVPESEPLAKGKEGKHKLPFFRRSQTVMMFPNGPHLNRKARCLQKWLLGALRIRSDSSEIWPGSTV